MKGAFFLLALLLAALLLGIAEAKFKKNFLKKTKDSAPKQHNTAPAKTEKNEEIELTYCLSQLQQYTSEVAVWDQKRESCLERLPPYIAQDEEYKAWWYFNRTEAIGCLLGLAQCNDANEALVTQYSYSKKQTVARGTATLSF